MRSSPMFPRPESDMSWLTVDPVPGAPLFGSQYTDTENALIERWQMCHTIARHAYAKGLNVTPMGVNKSYRWFKLWHAGGLATGYLMNATGVRFRGQQSPDKKGT